MQDSTAGARVFFSPLKYFSARGIQASMDKEKQRFGLALKKRRKQLGLTTMALSELAGCSEANIRLIESGSEPGVHRAGKILSALGVKMTIGRAPAAERRIQQ